MPRFTDQNTEGYSSLDLAALNEAFETVTARATGKPSKSWHDMVAEMLLARYDAGERGEALTH